MIKRYPFQCLLLISVILLITASCKSNKSSVAPVAVTATPATLGVYEADSSIYKILFIAVSKIGTQSINYDMLFDTGSGGMVLDANGILASSMITSSGFNFTGDSTIVNGITITNQKSMIEYGDDDSTTTKVYGNLAYAPVTVGDENGNMVIKRLPFFLYYKATNPDGSQADPHDFDTFGVSPEYDIYLSASAYITSPFSYYDPGTGLTRGFKMAALGLSNFSFEGTYEPILTVGLTASDLASSSGFVMHQLSYYNGDGYAPLIPGTITYGSKSVSTDIVFDTGTEPYSYIEDNSATQSIALLPASSKVTVATNDGFNYSYVTSSTENLTYIENPSTTGGEVSIVSLEYFLNNEYLLDYTNHRLGLKNN